MCCYWMYLIHCNNHTFCRTLAELWSCTPLHDIGTSNGAELTATSCTVWCSNICPYTSLCVTAQVLYTSHCRPRGWVDSHLMYSVVLWYLPLHFIVCHCTSTVHLPLQAMGWSCPMSSTQPLWMASTTLQTNWLSRTHSSTTGPTLLAMATPMGKGTMMQEALASSTPRWAGSCSATVHGAKSTDSRTIAVD